MIIKQAFCPVFCHGFCNTVESNSKYKLVQNKYKTSYVIEFCEMTHDQHVNCNIYLNTIMRDAIETFKALQRNSDSVNSMEDSNISVSNYVFEKLEPGNGISNKRHDIGLSSINNKPQMYVYTVLIFLNTVDRSECTICISHQEIKVNVITGNCVFIPCGVENTFCIKNENGTCPLYFVTCNILMTL